jgi:hypothetical protein
MGSHKLVSIIWEGVAQGDPLSMVLHGCLLTTQIHHVSCALCQNLSPHGLPILASNDGSGHGRRQDKKATILPAMQLPASWSAGGLFTQPEGQNQTTRASASVQMHSHIEGHGRAKWAALVPPQAGFCWHFSPPPLKDSGLTPKSNKRLWELRNWPRSYKAKC